MSLSKRLLDLARANLNALLDKAGGGETSIDELSDDELEAELERRKARRRREDEERAAAARAAEHARARAAANAAAGGAGAGRTTGTGAGAAQGRRATGSGGAGGARQQKAPPPAMGSTLSEKRLRELYTQLEVPYGAPFDEVKSSFRRLMRKYHPDLHVGNPQKHKTATQLTMSLTQAYNELEQYLLGGPNRGR